MFLAAVLANAPVRLLACSYVCPETDKHRVYRSDYVFVGRFQSLRMEPGFRVARVAVGEILKGHPPEVVELYASTENFCGPEFFQDTDQIYFVNLQNGRPIVKLCDTPYVRSDQPGTVARLKKIRTREWWWRKSISRIFPW